ncbi:MAG: regulator [Terrimesophilobacter sp.]
MRSIVVSLPSAIEPRIVSDIERHGSRVILRARGSGDVESAVAQGNIDCAVIGAGREHLSSLLLDACDVAGVRVVALAATDADRRYAADLGLREVLDENASWEQIEGVLSLVTFDDPAPQGLGDRRHDSALRPARVTDAEPRRGEVIAVWGPAGAPGRTTVAITVAAELAAEGYSVALADADTHSGAIAPSLGLLDEAPGFAAACRLASTNSLTTAELERVSERYSSPHGSFWVLTGIGRPHRWPELSGDRVAATLQACRGWVDYTIVDTGFSLESDEEISSDLLAPQRNAATITSLREADRVIAVGAGDPVGLSRFLRAHVDLLDLVDAERVLAVVNRIRGSVIGANPAAQVEQTLLRFGGIVASALVPNDQGSLDAAILSGKTLADVAAKSAPRLALRSLVTSRIMPQRLAPVKGRSLRDRFERRLSSPAG